MKVIPNEDLQFAKDYIRSNDEDFVQNLICCAMASVSNTCILTMQDLLGLDGSARMNQPSTLGKNWKWRALEDELFNPSAEDFLRRKTVLYQRCR